ncbi:MAG: hypothetical protein GEU94_08745 [Micromonosporaceae bacterium]|nr:hypothetical protein [Micromonosporaceae bacterium]
MVPPGAPGPPAEQPLGLAGVDPGRVGAVDGTQLSGQPPYDAFWGSRYAIVIDPDGNEVGLKGPVNDQRRYEPRVGE